MLGNIGTSELLLIFLVALLVFGAKRIPEIARGMGKGIREFKDAMHDIKSEITVEETKPRYQVTPPASYPNPINTTPPATHEQAPVTTSAAENKAS